MIERQDAAGAAAVRALVAAVAKRDGCTGRHSQRSADLGLLLAREVAPAEADAPQLTYGFLLHDIGKLAVPDAILGKPGPLTAAEMALMREHPETGVRMLEGLSFLDRALEVVRHHHERWDGGGYPCGLAGERIPLWARIFAIADAVDAMTSDRPYRAGCTLEQARRIVAEESGRQFDPACVEAFLGLDPLRVASYVAAAAPSVASKSLRGIGPTHGDVVPALR